MESLFSALKSTLESGHFFSLGAALALGYFGGILSSFTPCIYPMIPITVGFIGGVSERNIKDGWVLSSCYVIGMSVVYTVLGIFASLTGKIFGSITNQAGWHLALGIVMTLAALWMMDVFKFDPSISLSKFLKALGLKKNRLSENQLPENPPHKHTVPGAFILGASSGFIAAPCTTPVLTTILSYIATKGSVLYGGLLMFSFALGLGTILVVIGTLAGAVKVLPKPGPWMQSIKIFSGLLILGLGMVYVFKAGSLS